MCQAWQAYGLWFLVIAALGLGLAAGIAIGWRARIAKQWWAGISLRLRELAPAFALAKRPAIVVVVVGFGAWAWLFHGSH